VTRTQDGTLHQTLIIPATASKPMSGLTRQGKKKVNEELKRIAIQTVREAKDRAPVDTGRLRASITFEDEMRSNGFLRLVVGSNVDYAPFVEFGTERQAAQPYLRPALRQVLSDRLG